MNAWTVAYRKRTANRFQRVSAFAGTWDAAVELSRRVKEAHPELEVYYTTTLETEQANATENPELYGSEVANILVDSGKRIRVMETGSLDALGMDVDLHATYLLTVDDAPNGIPRANEYPCNDYADALDMIGSMRHKAGNTPMAFTLMKVEAGEACSCQGCTDIATLNAWGVEPAFPSLHSGDFLMIPATFFYGLVNKVCGESQDIRFAAERLAVTVAPEYRNAHEKPWKVEIKPESWRGSDWEFGPLTREFEGLDAAINSVSLAAEQFAAKLGYRQRVQQKTPEAGVIQFLVDGHVLVQADFTLEVITHYMLGLSETPGTFYRNVLTGDVQTVVS